MFEGDVSHWDVSRVTNMSQMFARATQFNGDLSRWDVNQVEDMSFMFCQAI
jgi:surface protein